MVSLSLPSGLAPPSIGVGRAQVGLSFSSSVSTRDWSLTETSPNSATIDSSTFSVPSRALRYTNRPSPRLATVPAAGLQFSEPSAPGIQRSSVATSSPSTAMVGSANGSLKLPPTSGAIGSCVSASPVAPPSALAWPSASACMAPPSVWPSAEPSTWAPASLPLWPALSSLPSSPPSSAASAGVADTDRVNAAAAAADMTIRIVFYSSEPR